MLFAFAREWFSISEKARLSATRLFSASCAVEAMAPPFSETAPPTATS